MTYILSLDQGTSSSRAILFDEDGRVISNSQIEHKQYFPQSGYVEHDPEEIYENCVNCMKNSIEKAGLKLSDVSSLGITNQRETTIVWNKLTGKPYHNAIVWNDIRTTDICRRISLPDKNKYRSITGLPISSYFSLSKLIYLLETVPGLKEEADRGLAIFGTIDSYLIWKLTNGQAHKTDVTNASRTLMMNLSSLNWDMDILNECNIPKSMLPEICPSIGAFGSIQSEECLLGIPIMAVLGYTNTLKYITAN